jgi:hypothetical protein
MGIIEVLAGLFNGKPGRDGMWDFLGKWAVSRTQVKLEQVHNDGTQKLIPLLQPGTVVIERGRGWTREIRVPEVSRPTTVLNTVISQSLIPPLPADGLSPSLRPQLAPGPRNELGPAADPC